MNTASPCGNISDYLNSPSGPILHICAGPHDRENFKLDNDSVFGAALHAYAAEYALKKFNVYDVK